MSNIFKYNEDNYWKKYFLYKVISMKSFNSNLIKVDKQYKFPK